MMDLGFSEVEHFVQIRVESNDMLLKSEELQEKYDITNDTVMGEQQRLVSFAKERKIDAFTYPHENFSSLRVQSNMILLRSEKLRNYFQISDEQIEKEIKIHHEKTESISKPRL